MPVFEHVWRWWELVVKGIRLIFAPAQLIDMKRIMGAAQRRQLKLAAEVSMLGDDFKWAYALGWELSCASLRC